MSQSNEQAKTGIYSQKVEIYTINAGTAKNITFTEGGTYEASVWIYVPTTYAQSWRLRNSTNSVDWFLGKTVPVGEWTNLTGTLEITAGTKQVTFYNNTSAAGVFYIDDFTIKKVAGLITSYNMIPSEGGIVVDTSHN